MTNELKKETQINNLKDKIDFLLTAGRISFIEYNFKTDIFDCNQVFNEITGYNFNNTPLDLNWLISRIHPNNIELFKSEINKIKKNYKKYLELEFRMLNAENKYIWFHFHGQMDSKQPHVLTGILNDITNNKRLLNELINARNKSINANELKTRFVANISHEIRTPMNAILGFTGLLKNHIKDAPLSNYISSIESSGKTLLKLINDLLDIEKINSGKIEIKKEKVNLDFLLDDIYQTFILFANNKGITLDIVKQSDIPSEILTDTLKIKQILINLTNNAIKFTDKGGVKIEYSFLADKHHNYGTLNLIISDTGIGIPLEKQKIIFEPFIQEDLNSNRQHEGTGLGLSIVQQIITLMGGTIVLESNPGKGSRFSISIPKIIFSSHKEVHGNTYTNNNGAYMDSETKIASEETNKTFLSTEEKSIIKQKFNTKLIPLWKQLSEMLSLTDLNIFIKEVSEITLSIPWKELENYNKILKANVKSFDFEQLLLQIKEFKQFIDYVNTHF